MTFPCTDVEAHKDACYVVQLGINNNLSGEHAPKVGWGPWRLCLGASGLHCAAVRLAPGSACRAGSAAPGLALPPALLTSLLRPAAASPARFILPRGRHPMYPPCGSAPPPLPPQVRALFHAFIEAFFQLPCSCEAAEERRRAQPTRTSDAPLVRRGRRPKAAASEPNSMEVRRAVPAVLCHAVLHAGCCAALRAPAELW